MIIEDIKNIWLALVYALSYAYGDVLAISFDNHLWKIASKFGIKKKRGRKKKTRIRKKKR